MIAKAAISTRAFRFLVQLAEQEPPIATARVLEDEIGPEGEKLTGGALLVPGKPLDSIRVALADGETQASIEFDHATSVASYFHPEAGFVDVAADELRTWRLDTAAFMALICRLLGLPSTRKPIPLVDGLLWDLGTPRLGRRTGIPVLFARRLVAPDVRASLNPELKLRLGAKPSLLLTSAQWVPDDLILPAVSRIIPVGTVLSRGSSDVELDLYRLAAMAYSRPAAVERQVSPVECSPDGSWLRIHERQYLFRGKKKRLIRLLYEAWARGAEWVSEEWLLAEAEYDSDRIEDVFKDKRPEKRNAWREYIETHDGQVRLKVPARL